MEMDRTPYPIDKPNKRLKVFLISSVVPEPTSAGQLVLHRHLHDEAAFEVVVCRPNEGLVSPAEILRKCLAKVLRHQRCREAAWALFGGRWLDGLLPQAVDRDDSSIVLTVAHGDCYPAAKRFARKHGLPLVSIFHDWWPDIARPIFPIDRLLQAQFRAIYRNSDVALCVSEGMLRHLGRHSDAEVLYPMPGRASQRLDQGAPNLKFDLLYFGNLGVYEGLVRGALETFEEAPDVRLVVRGAGSRWDHSFEERMRRNGSLLEFLPAASSEFHSWLATADAFLIPVDFSQRRRREMATNFPSKLVEAAQYGRPLVIWGPPWASAVHWAQRTGTALCVTDPDPRALAQALSHLNADPGERRRLGEAAASAAMQEFHPQKLQSQFVAALHRAVEIHSARLHVPIS